MVVRNLWKSEQQCWRSTSRDNDRHFHRGCQRHFVSRQELIAHIADDICGES